MPPDLALEQFLRGLLRPLDDSLAPIRVAAQAQITALTNIGAPLPAFVQTIVNELMATSALAGLPRFEPGHAARVYLQSERAPTAGLYLSQPGTDAITLDRLIIMKNLSFDALYTEPLRTTADVLCGRASSQFGEAISLLMHELVHARQWDVIGQDAFLNNYLIETLTFGYGSDTFETEAFALGDAVEALLAGNAGCTEGSIRHAQDINVPILTAPLCRVFPFLTECVGK